MITEDRKIELADAFAAGLERYLDKQWIDSEIAAEVGESDEEKAFLRKLGYSVVTEYSTSHVEIQK